MVVSYTVGSAFWSRLHISILIFKNLCFWPPFDPKLGPKWLKWAFFKHGCVIYRWKRIVKQITYININFQEFGFLAPFWPKIGPKMTKMGVFQTWSCRIALEAHSEADYRYHCEFSKCWVLAWFWPQKGVFVLKINGKKCKK